MSDTCCDKEHDELIAATLAAGILAAQGGLTTTAEAIVMYRVMLVELRDSKGATGYV